MKIAFVTLLFVFGFFVCQAQTKTQNLQGTKENPVEKSIAKNQVRVELQQTKDADGKILYSVKETKIIIPDSFPKYVDTGDPKSDEAVYYEAKQKWIQEHPAEFEKIKHLNL